MCTACVRVRFRVSHAHALRSGGRHAARCTAQRPHCVPHTSLMVRTFFFKRAWMEWILGQLSHGQRPMIHEFALARCHVPLPAAGVATSSPLTYRHNPVHTPVHIFPVRFCARWHVHVPVMCVRCLHALRACVCARACVCVCARACAHTCTLVRTHSSVAYLWHPGKALVAMTTT